MAQPSIKLEFPDMEALAKEFRKLPKTLAAVTIGAGLRRAIKPAESALKQTTPVGATGNLRRGVATKVKRYPKTGTAVAVVGFRKPGSSKPPKSGTKRRNRPGDKTQHQFLVEFGTKPRLTKAGAYRGVMPAAAPIKKAADQSMGQVTANLQREMVKAAENAVKQLAKYTAAKTAKSRG